MWTTLNNSLCIKKINRGRIRNKKLQSQPQISKRLTVKLYNSYSIQKYCKINSYTT